MKDEIFKFDDFVLIPGERLLMRDGEILPLAPKAFDLLVALVRRNGHLVSKDELLQEVWPGRFVEEVNLSVNVSTVRKALGRNPDGTALIQTVSKGGYRFVAPVAARYGSTFFTTMAQLSAAPPSQIRGAARVRHTRSAQTPTCTVPISKDVITGASARKRA